MWGSWFIPMFAAVSLSGALSLLPIDLAARRVMPEKKDFVFQVLESPVPPPVEKVPDPIKPPPEKITKPKPIVKKVRPKRVKRKQPKPTQVADFAPIQKKEEIEEYAEPEPIKEVLTETLPEPPPPPKPEINLRAYGKTVYGAVVKHKNYPRVARRLELEGKVLVRVTVGPEGALVSATVKRSSGHDLLDQEALRMVEKAAPFERLPLGFDRPSATVVLPIKFRLRD